MVLKEWIDYLKTGHIKEDTTAPGLAVFEHDKKERLAYDEHMNAVMIQNDVLDTAKEEGRAEGIIDTARNLKQLGLSVEMITLIKEWDIY